MQTSRISQFVFMLIVLLAALVMFQHFMRGNVAQIAYSDMETYVRQGDVEEVKLYKNAGQIRGTFREGSAPAETLKTKQFVTGYFEGSEEGLLKLLSDSGVKYDPVNPTLWDTIFNGQT